MSENLGTFEDESPPLTRIESKKYLYLIAACHEIKSNSLLEEEDPEIAN
jgi:hypothetical protein